MKSPITDDTINAFERRACGLNYVHGVMAQLEQRAERAEAEVETYKRLYFEEETMRRNANKNNQDLRAEVDALREDKARLDCYESYTRNGVRPCPSWRGIDRRFVGWEWEGVFYPTLRAAIDKARAKGAT